MLASHSIHKLSVASVHASTRNAIVITFAVPVDLQKTFDFVQGPYITLRATIDGQEMRRAYSICSAVRDKRLQIAIKKVAGGALRKLAKDHLLPESVIEVMPPQGNFHISLLPRDSCHVTAFAAGSGITPILSII